MGADATSSGLHRIEDTAIVLRQFHARMHIGFACDRMMSCITTFTIQIDRSPVIADKSHDFFLLLQHLLLGRLYTYRLLAFFLLFAMPTAYLHEKGHRLQTCRRRLQLLPR